MPDEEVHDDAESSDISMTVAVITIVAGRHQHLLNQQLGLQRGNVLPDLYVVVGMDDPEALRLTCAGPLASTGISILPVPVPTAGGQLPLAAARNAGVAAAIDAGADTLILLDVDCIPSADLVACYARAIATEQVSSLVCGVVRYLDRTADVAELEAGVSLGVPHAARPTPLPGELFPTKDWQLFWSLSFAVSAATWRSLDGFCEEYRGYGAEDTDFGYRAFLAGMDICWLGGADAFHQYHDTERPPVRHLHDIVANATIFHRRWGFWPMEGWLLAFRDLGLAEYNPTTDSWTVVGPSLPDQDALPAG